MYKKQKETQYRRSNPQKEKLSWREELIWV